MINGYSTLGAVALRLIEDNSRGGLDQYSLDMAVETVCWRRETLALALPNPTYVWWHLSLDEEPHIDFDPGKGGARTNGRGSRLIYPTIEGTLEVEDLIGPWLDPWSPTRRDDRILSVEVAMLRAGIQPYQRCLTRYTEHYSHSDDGGDFDTAAELIFVEPYQSLSIYLPVLVADPWPTWQMRGLRVED